MGRLGKCCCVPPECEWLQGAPPTITIPRMHPKTPGVANLTNCCFIQCFEFDELEPLQRFDLGDVMNYDRVAECTYELYLIRETCPTVTQFFWRMGDPTRDPSDPNEVHRVPGEEDYLIFTPEPPYVGCCNPASVLNTLKTRQQDRGGTRFVLSYRLNEVCVTIQLVTEHCPPAPPVPKWIVTWTAKYYGFYEFIPYGEKTVRYTFGIERPNCYQVPIDTAQGSWPYYFDWPGTNGSGFTFEVCRSQIFNGKPVGDLTFADGDIPVEPCANPYPQPACAECNTEQTCITSGPVGSGEPYSGFCEPTVVVQYHTAYATGVKTCFQHKYYAWTNEAAELVSDEFGNPPTTASDMECAPPLVIDWPDGVRSPWLDIPVCSLFYSWIAIQNMPADFQCATFNYRLDAGGECFEYLTCPQCPTGPKPNETPLHQDDPADVNLVVPPDMVTNETAITTYNRPIEMTRTINCSGYIEREHCVPFAGGTINIA